MTLIGFIIRLHSLEREREREREMKLFHRLRFRKRRDRNPSYNLVIEKEDEMESSDTARERSEMDEASERKTEMEAAGNEEPSERKRDVERVRERKFESPPVDDCCPICFGSFTVPCRGPCGHWYCGDCILQYWNHSAALQPCKCPMCSQLITRLIPEASFDHCQDVKVLDNVRKYNSIFVGGAYGLILKVLGLPLLIKRIFREMMDPDAANNHLFKARLFALLLGALYSVSPFDFLPTGRLDAIDLFDYFAIAMVFILYMIGLYRRRQQWRHVRQLAAAQP